MIILNAGYSVNVSLAAGESLTVTGRDRATVAAVSGLNVTAGTLGTVDGSTTFGPFSDAGVVSITANSGECSYGINPAVSGNICIQPSGDITGATDAANINSALLSCSVVTLSSDADYYVNAPIILDGVYSIPSYNIAGNKLKGGGIGSTIIHQVGTNFPVIKKANRDIPSTNNAIACSAEGLTILGADASGADSCAIFLAATGGGNYFNHIFIQGFTVGVRMYDNTITEFDDLQLRACGTGMQFGWQSDIVNVRNSRIQECTVAGIANGWTDPTYKGGAVFNGTLVGGNLTVNSITSGAVVIGQSLTGVGITGGTVITGGSGTSFTTNGSQSIGPIAMQTVVVTSNGPIRFEQCRFGKNAVTADWSDYDSDNLVFDQCYFEDETKIMWLGAQYMTTSAPKKTLFADCHFEYPNVTPAGHLIEMRNPYTANCDITLERCQCAKTLPSNVRYLKAGVNTSIHIDACVLPHTDGHITYYTGATQSYAIALTNTGSAFPTVDFTANTQHVNYYDGSTLSATVPAAAMQMTGGTDKMFEKWERLAANTGAVVNTANCAIRDIDGKWVLYDGVIRLHSPAAALPTASSLYRGVMAYQADTSGTAPDTVKCCMRMSDGTSYAWVTVSPMKSQSTGAQTTTLGTNAPSAIGTLTPTTWMAVTLADGTTGYMPVWK